MKKKFLSVVALGLAFGFAFSAGCSKDPVNPVKPFDPADPTTAKTEDDIYTAVKYGVDEYGKYAGAMTIVTEYKTGYSEAMGDEIDSQEQANKVTISYDPTAKTLFMNQESTMTEVDGTETTVMKRTTISKLFKDGEQYYGYSKMSMKMGDAEEQVQEQKYKITDAYVGEMIAQMKETYADVEAVKEYLPDYDFTTIKNAYNTVYSTQLETQKAKDANAKATASVTATNTDGTLEAKIVTSSETTDEIYDGLSGLIKADKETKVVTKDSKLSEYYMNVEVSASATQDGVAVAMSESEEGTCKITYSFDQAGYDAIVAGDMSEAIEMPSAGERQEVVLTLAIGDSSVQDASSYPATKTAQDAFNEFTGRYNGGSAYTMAWYTDKDCTTAVDWTDKKADFLNGKTFYGKLTVAEGYAVVVMERKSVDSRSEAYKIVFGEVNDVSDMDINGYDVANGESTYTFMGGESYGLKPVVYVDGVKQAETVTSLTCEANKKYVVTYSYEYTDTYERANIFKPY